MIEISIQINGIDIITIIGFIFTIRPMLQNQFKMVNKNSTSNEEEHSD